MPTRMFGLTLAAAALIAVAGCSSQSASSVTKPVTGSIADAHIVMDGGNVGYATWPSGARWIVMKTSDGWNTVSNVTPMAVPTDGGLALEANPSGVAVGVRPYKLLTVSPVLVSTDGGAQWKPVQTPGALARGTDVATTTTNGVWVVLANSSVAYLPNGSSAWVTFTPHGFGPGFTPTAVSSPDGHVVVVGGRSTAHTVAFVTPTDGRSWQTVIAPASGSTGAACQLGSTLALPLMTSTGITLMTRFGSESAWTAYPGPTGAGSSASLGCNRDAGLWVAQHSGGRLKVWRTAVQGNAVMPGTQMGDLEPWEISPEIPVAVYSIAPVTADQGVAVTANPTVITGIDVRGDAGRATPKPLPSWVATVGGPVMKN